MDKVVSVGAVKLLISLKSFNNLSMLQFEGKTSKELFSEDIFRENVQKSVENTLFSEARFRFKFTFAPNTFFSGKFPILMILG